MKIAVTGPNGRVGKFMVDNYGLTPLFFNITDPNEIAKVLDKEKPHVILHTAGLSDPDYCEDPKNLNEVVNVNFKGAVNVFSAAAERGIITVYLSSSQVFSGHTFLGIGHKYKENDVSHLRPVNVYGLSKRITEAARLPFGDRVKIVRTSHLFDYVRVMGLMQNKIDAPTFIKRNYMYLPHFAGALMTYLYAITEMPPILHIAGSDTVSQYNFLKEFISIMGLKNAYHIDRRRYEISGRAPRPHFAGLDVGLSRKIGIPQYSYLDGIRMIHMKYVLG